MDSRHRHELEQNLLAKWLVSQYEDWIRPNSSWLGYAVLGVLVAVAIIIGTSRMNSWNLSSSWKQFYAALHSEQADAELELVAQSTSGIVGAHARLALAQRQLTEGCGQVFINKREAIGLLEKAIASFQQVQKATSDSQILQQAGLGLGLCWETLAAARVGDDLAKAEEEYQKVIDRWKDDASGKQAQERLASIRRPTTKTFLALTAAKVPEEVGTGQSILGGMGLDWDEPITPTSGPLGFDILEPTAVIEEQKPDEEPEQPIQEPEKPEPDTEE